ncbi:multiple sugar transport system substrate-binding protein [Paenibacillus sp. DS2015]|uniref:extracellular solute-binding protein n=1 Tax=Paenibacillus sp. DS2015 TaxID=3373917 RepID=UPI003D1A1371
MNTKWTRLIPAMVILLFILSACGTGNAGNGNSQEPAEVKITFWHHYSTASPEEKTLTEKLIPEFEKQNPGIKVKAVAIPWDELHRKLQINGNGGELPDVARLDIIWVPELKEQGLLVSLDEQFDDFDTIAQGMLEGPLSTAKVGEHYYGLPLNTNTKVLFWNKEMLQQSGIDKPPATMDGFFDTIKAVKSQNEKVWGYGEPALQGWNILPWIWSNGGDILSPDYSSADGYLNAPSTVDIISKLREAYASGGISGFKPGDLSVTEGHAQGSYAMMAEGPWSVAQFNSQFPDYQSNMAPFPAGSAGSIQVLGGEDLGILSEKNKEESWKFVKFMVSEAAQVEMGKIGQIPVNLGAMQNEEIKAIDYYVPFIEQLKTAKARPPINEWPQIDNVLSDTMSRIFMTDKDIKTELDASVEQINKLLKR